MMLVKAILVVFFAEIESGLTSSTKGNEETKIQLPPDSYINATDAEGCWYPQIVDYIEGQGLTVTLELLDEENVNITVGSCDQGCCAPASPPQHRTITLMSAAEDEEEHKKKDKKQKKSKKNENKNKNKNKNKNNKNS
ncbi:uncharacterized protein LOC120848696 [Ixodes scapularis]|uniref:uncharacterized protein LOC120848696 n=1 Tax=Ixodes scapularis TaxID=6945 RepID=UPI001A9F0460|nr:uncharacterized protein LOC120848696 [Ixodes scapularis]